MRTTWTRTRSNEQSAHQLSGSKVRRYVLAHEKARHCGGLQVENMYWPSSSERSGLAPAVADITQPSKADQHHRPGRRLRNARRNSVACNGPRSAVGSDDVSCKQIPAGIQDKVSHRDPQNCQAKRPTISVGRAGTAAWAVNAIRENAIGRGALGARENTEQRNCRRFTLFGLCPRIWVGLGNLDRRRGQIQIEGESRMRPAGVNKLGGTQQRNIKCNAASNVRHGHSA